MHLIPPSVSTAPSYKQSSCQVARVLGINALGNLGERDSVRIPDGVGRCEGAKARVFMHMRPDDMSSHAVKVESHMEATPLSRRATHPPASP